MAGRVQIVTSTGRCRGRCLGVALTYEHLTKQSPTTALSVADWLPALPAATSHLVAVMHHMAISNCPIQHSHAHVVCCLQTMVMTLPRSALHCILASLCCCRWCCRLAGLLSCRRCCCCMSTHRQLLLLLCLGRLPCFAALAAGCCCCCCCGWLLLLALIDLEVRL